MKVLIACEESQEVCKAFRALGHEAYSCDILECSGGHPEWHIQADILPLLNGNCTFTTMDGVEHMIDGKWDMIIAFVLARKQAMQEQDIYTKAASLISHGTMRACVVRRCSLLYGQLIAKR